MIYDPRRMVQKVYNFKSWLSTLSLAFILYVISCNNLELGSRSGPDICPLICAVRIVLWWNLAACCPSPTLLAFYEITRALEKIMQIFCTLLPLFVLTVRACRVRPHKICLCRITYPDFILVVSLWYPGCILVVSWLYPGCILFVSWLNRFVQKIRIRLFN